MTEDGGLSLHRSVSVHAIQTGMMISSEICHLKTKTNEGGI